MKVKLGEILKPTVSLFLICLVATLLLGGANLLTGDKILAVAAAEEEAARLKVCPAAARFEEMRVDVAGEEYPLYRGVDADGACVGYALTTAGKSYGGAIELMTGFDAEGAIVGVEILKIDDTPGLGMNAKKAAFREQFVGKRGELEVRKAAPAENEIQALTGASVTSKAVTECVNLAARIVQSARGGELNG